MKKFEHLIVSFDDPDYEAFDDLTMEEIFNHFGDKGYEFVSFIDGQTGAVFKKEIIEKEKYEFGSFVINFPIQDTEEFSNKLKQLGEDGWQIASSVYSDNALGEAIMLFFLQRKI